MLITMPHRLWAVAALRVWPVESAECASSSGALASGKAARQVPVPLEAWSDVNKRIPKLSAGHSSKLWVCFRFRACLFGAVEVDGSATSSGEIR